MSCNIKPTSSSVPIAMFLVSIGTGKPCLSTTIMVISYHSESLQPPACLSILSNGCSIQGLRIWQTDWSGSLTSNERDCIDPTSLLCGQWPSYDLYLTSGCSHLVSPLHWCAEAVEWVTMTTALATHAHPIRVVQCTAVVCRLLSVAQCGLPCAASQLSLRVSQPHICHCCLG